jgi:murein DD-endopeptidase MepM/ murein hydrolase activator NlpD
VKRLLAFAFVLALAAAALTWRAQVLRVVPTALLPIAPHDQYSAALALAGLARTEGRAWDEAAERALDAPAESPLQYETDAVFDSVAPRAQAWRFTARRGQRVTIDVSGAPGALFLDLYDGGSRTRVAFAPARSTQLSEIVGRDGELIARVQPRLDAPGTYHITQRTTASLLFPVQGLTGAAVQSSFGAGRDAGRRRHQGIDIFAPRGTPVVAATHGWITRQTSNRLGGNVVWLWAPAQHVSLYYAHLDRQAVTPGQHVNAGDVVGYVGNTGNARTTAPHLHFGVYAAMAGAVDPFPYVVDPVVRKPRRHRE